MKIARRTGVTQGTRMRIATLALICITALSPAASRARGVPLLAPVEEVAAARSTRDRNDDDDRKRKPAPDRRRPTVLVEKANPAAVGLGAAGGAFAGAMIGVVGTSAAAFFALGLAGQQTPAVMVSAAVVALGLAAATPFLAALGGGAAVILLDPRSSKDEWTGLLQCAAAGYCLGVSMIAGSVCGAPMFCGPSMGTIPGPDRPAEWTGGAAIAGLFAGGLSGALIGWVVAPNPSDPIVPAAAGALGGAAIGASLSAGVGAAIATALRP
jgi:hypothetical protein